MSGAWLERHLKDYPGSVVAITHDRYFLDHVAGWILELDRGAAPPVIAEVARSGVGIFDLEPSVWLPQSGRSDQDDQLCTAGAAGGAGQMRLDESVLQTDVRAAEHDVKVSRLESNEAFHQATQQAKARVPTRREAYTPRAETHEVRECQVCGAEAG